MSVEINVQFVFKNRARIQANIDAYVDEWWDPMSMGLSDSEIKTISSGAKLLEALYAGCFPDAETEDFTADDDFRVFDADYRPFTDKILAMQDFSGIERIVIKSRYEYFEEGINFSDTTILHSGNCPFISAETLYTTEELAKKQISLHQSLTSNGKNAFSGCDQLVLNVLEGSAAQRQLEKNGFPHNVIPSNVSRDKTIVAGEETQRELVGHIKETTVWSPYFRALRLATKNKVYILYHEFNENVMESDERVFFDPEDYMPEIRDAKIIWGENELNTIPELLAGLYFVLSDKIDFEILKATFSLIAETISTPKAIAICLNCHNTMYPNAFPKGTFDTLKKFNTDEHTNEDVCREAVLQQIFAVFNQRIPNFEETVETFVDILRNVKSLSDILFVDAVEGIDGEHELTDEEMWKTTHKLDFYELDFIAEERKHLAEEELKRKEAEERKRRKEEEREQKETEARRIAEEKAKAEAEARRMAEEKYQADLKSWEETCENIKKQREQAVTERVAAEKATLEQAAQKAYDIAVSAATNRKKTAQQNKADAELRLGKLGLFKFAEKNAMKEAIAQAETEIAAAEKELEQAKHDLNTTLATIPQKVSVQEVAIRKSVEAEIPFPAKPTKDL